jgi:hypothetical protein
MNAELIRANELASLALRARSLERSRALRALSLGARAPRAPPVGALAGFGCSSNECSARA